MIRQLTIDYPKDTGKNLKEIKILLFLRDGVKESTKSNDLKRPVNELEKKYDQDLSWRKKVNNELKKNYSKIFKMIDTMIYLKVPNFSYVHKWRLQKTCNKIERKKIMNKQQIKTFIML